MLSNYLGSTSLTLDASREAGENAPQLTGEYQGVSQSPKGEGDLWHYSKFSKSAKS